jgi:hypothetical protein
MVRFPLHNEIEEIRVVETGIRKETVSCLLFHYFEKLILQSEIFWRTLEKMGKVKSVVCTLTKEGEEYMRQLGILP